MKTEKFQLRGKNSVCAGAFQLLRGRAPAQLRGNTELKSPTIRANSVFFAETQLYANRLSCLQPQQNNRTFQVSLHYTEFNILP
jgi:hypothetical protein